VKVDDRWVWRYNSSDYHTQEDGDKRKPQRQECKKNAFDAISIASGPSKFANENNPKTHDRTYYPRILGQQGI